jgi:hypothetical protein
MKVPGITVIVKLPSGLNGYVNWNEATGVMLLALEPNGVEAKVIEVWEIISTVPVPSPLKCFETRGAGGSSVDWTRERGEVCGVEAARRLQTEVVISERIVSFEIR